MSSLFMIASIFVEFKNIASIGVYFRRSSVSSWAFGGCTVYPYKEWRESREGLLHATDSTVRVAEFWAQKYNFIDINSIRRRVYL